MLIFILIYLFYFLFFIDTTGEFRTCSKGRYPEGKGFIIFFVYFINHEELIFLCVLLFFYCMQIWDSVPKPQAHKETPLSEFFNVRCYNFMQDSLGMCISIFREDLQFAYYNY